MGLMGMFGFNSDFILRDKSDEKGYRDVDMVYGNFRKPIVIALSGNGAIEKEWAFKFCLMAERSLDLLFKGNETGNKIQENIDILGCSYMGFGLSGMLMPEDIKNIVYSVLIPRVTNPSGELYPIDICKKNISQVAFYTYCWGASEVNKICDFFKYKLKSYKAHDSDIDEILSAMTQVSYSPNNMNFCIPTIYAISKKDSVNYNLYFDDDEPMIEGIRLIKGKNSIGVLSSNLLNKLEGDRDEHFINYVARDRNWEIKSEDGVQSPNADCVSLMLSWALAKVVDYGMDNAKSKNYVPRDGQMLQELSSIIQSFDHDQLISK